MSYLLMLGLVGSLHAEVEPKNIAERIVSSRNVSLVNREYTLENIPKLTNDSNDSYLFRVVYIDNGRKGVSRKDELRYFFRHENEVFVSRDVFKARGKVEGSTFDLDSLKWINEEVYGQEKHRNVRILVGLSLGLK